jgi:hypothetical protein
MLYYNEIFAGDQGGPQLLLRAKPITIRHTLRDKLSMLLMRDLG